MKRATSFTSSQKYVDLFLILLLDFTSTVTIAFFDSSSVLFPVKRMMATSSYELIQMEDKKYYLLNITSFLIIFYTFIILGHTGRLPSFFLSKKAKRIQIQLLLLWSLHSTRIDPNATLCIGAIYRISSYIFYGNYSFLNLENVENWNSWRIFQFLYLINWIFAAETIQGLKLFGAIRL